MQLTILILAIAMTAALLFVAVRLLRDRPDREELARLQARERELSQAAEQRDAKSREVEQLQIDKARLEADLVNEQRVAQEKLTTLQEAEERLKKEFENLANRIFEEKGKTLTEQNRERMTSLLDPFKDQLHSFRTRVDKLHTEDTERSARLLEQVRQLQEFSRGVSDQANNLAQAIKGDAKQQGDWGELIVERIFEASGLEKGREYESQVGLRSEEGLLQRPDFVVNLPQKKVVIVDSKVSLTSYERYAAAENEDERALHLAEHLKSVRKHVKELQAKDYSQLLGNRTLDFVIMCIPIEPAYQAAHQHDEKLMYDLARSNVVITGPNSLMITLKLISQVWRRENENRNAEKIADQAGRMYNQVRLIIESMTEAQTRLKNVSESFGTAMDRLVKGRGNLVGRVEELRKLGAKVKKQLPPELVEGAGGSDLNEAPDLLEQGDAGEDS